MGAQTHGPDPRLRVAVVGGSLGGLTAALLLRDFGCTVDVFERSGARLSGFGAGIVVHEATMRYFVERARQQDGLSVAARALRFLDTAGHVLHEEPSPYEFTAWSTLYSSLYRLFGEEHYHHGHALDVLDQDADCVRVRFENERVHECDLVVCADGIGSRARAQLAPAIEPEYAGYVGWRGTIGASRLGSTAAAQLTDAITYGVVERSHILSYPIPSLGGSSDPLLNFVWYRNVAAGEALDELLVSRSGRASSVSLHPGEVQERHLEELRLAAAATLPPAFAEMVAAAVDPFVQVIVDLAVPAMAYGRICLIGDAAFAARPHAAAGTAKAAENAWKLLEALEQEPDPRRALAAWEPGQLELGRRLVDRSRRIGDRYQLTSTADPRDQELRFGLYGPGR
ncbi:MAG: monooxygenase [Candidatus Rokuibacteriota bacterium]|nr:MAG: monooxygenase [Candidatus Rokubacteria bacterium]